jgi:hypothetical protein
MSGFPSTDNYKPMNNESYYYDYQANRYFHTLGC